MLEKHVHDSFMTYLTSHKLLHSTQSGFRPNHSCETALLQMVNEFLEAMYKKCACVYVGLKVFHAACIILYACKSSLYFILVFFFGSSL